MDRLEYILETSRIKFKKLSSSPTERENFLTLNQKNILECSQILSQQRQESMLSVNEKKRGQYILSLLKSYDSRVKHQITVSGTGLSTSSTFHDNQSTRIVWRKVGVY